jgi:hypothetical protein
VVCGHSITGEFHMSAIDGANDAPSE